MDEIMNRVAAVRARVDAAARAAGRDASEIALIGVSKTNPAERVAAAFGAGLTQFGENRVQEAEPKIAALAELRASLTWHLIGHLQTNKARRAGQLFDYVHSVDSLRLAEGLARGAAGRPAPLPILLQVNVSGEASKDGMDFANWERDAAKLEAGCAAIESILGLEELAVRGLMTIAPWGDDPQLARPTFASCRMLRDELAARFPQASWRELSMGMSDDFAVAIAEGATMVRVGRAIFGERG